jgi:hypothetical protein
LYRAFVWARRALKHLKRWFPARAVVKAKRDGLNAYTDARKFGNAMLTELFKELGREPEHIDDHDLYQAVFVGFIAHLSEADVAELRRQPEVDDGPGPAGRLSALRVFHSHSVFYGVFVWARRALNSQKRHFPARAVEETGSKGATATKRPTSADGLAELQRQRRALVNGSWSRTLGVKGQQSTKAFAWFAPGLRRHGGQGCF